MTNPLYTHSLLPTTSQAAFREFDTRLVAAMAAAPVPAWTNYGLIAPTTTTMTSFPLSSLVLQYQQTQGESRFRGAAEKSLDLKVEEFDEGIEASLLDLFTKVFAWQRWQQGPVELLKAEARHRNKQIATLLHTGHSSTWGGASTPIDGANFFSASHKANFADASSATWSNYQSSGKTVLDISNIEEEVTAMQSGVRDQNGDIMDVNPDTIIVPAAVYEPLKNLLAQNMILDSSGTAGVTNPYVGKFKVEKATDLDRNDVNDWYLVDSQLASAMPPWLALRLTVPDSLGLRRFDEASDFFKNTGKIKTSSHIWYGFSLGLPYAIRKVTGA